MYASSPIVPREFRDWSFRSLPFCSDGVLGLAAATKKLAHNVFFCEKWFGLSEQFWAFR